MRTADGERAVGPVPRGHARGGARVLHPPLRRARLRGAAARAAGARRRPLPRRGHRSRSARSRPSSVEPNAVGDLVGLSARLDALGPLLGIQRGQRREEKARRLEESRTRKTEIVAEAEKIAQGKDWRNGVNRLRELLDEWKALPRLEKKRDDELWHRFSTARTAYTRRRKAHFSELNEKRGEAHAWSRSACSRRPSRCSDSTEWGPTSSRYRALMQDWKAAGAAPRDVEEDLWQRFRAAQDAFFGARDAANAEQDKEFAANAENKEELLVEAEALLPVTDLDAAKRAFRSIAERWDAAGKVPRDQMKSLEARIRKVEQAIRSVEDDQWRRSDPEKSARADDMLGQLERAIAGLEADLEKARAAGDDRKVKDLEDNLASRRQFLEMAQKAASEFS